MCAVFARTDGRGETCGNGLFAGLLYTVRPFTASEFINKIQGFILKSRESTGWLELKFSNYYTLFCLLGIVDFIGAYTSVYDKLIEQKQGNKSTSRHLILLHTSLPLSLMQCTILRMLPTWYCSSTII